MESNQVSTRAHRDTTESPDLPIVRVSDVVVETNGTRILHGIDAEFYPGTINCLVGPNGSGKSTLLNSIAGVRDFNGSILVGERSLDAYSRKERVKKIAYVAQHENVETDLTVRQIVELGMLVERGPMSRLADDDHVEIDRALDHNDLTHLQDRSWNSLSGGERQRTQLARAVAQHAEILILDEPTNHLDIHHRIKLMERLAHQAYGHDLCVLMAIHELDLAVRFSDNILVLDGGRAAASGSAAEAITPSMLADVFGISAHIHQSGPAVSLVVDSAVQNWQRTSVHE